MDYNEWIEHAEKVAEGTMALSECLSLRESTFPEPPLQELDERISFVSYITAAIDPRSAADQVLRFTLGLEAEMAGQNRIEVYADLLRCILGNPFLPVALDPSWRTTTILDLARAIYEERAFDRLPILADALQEAGCNNEDMLAHCRGPGPHARGCWVVDLVLGKT